MIAQIPYSFLRDFRHGFKIEVFRRILYFFLLLNTISLLPIAHDLWAYEGVIGTRGWDFYTPTWRQGSYALLNVLSHPVCYRMPWIYIVFIAGQITFLITGILRFLPKISAVMVYFFSTNLFLKGFLMFTGGEVLASLLLFYLMFIHAPENTDRNISLGYRIRKDEYANGTPMRNVLNNAFYLILLIQICLLYFFSTLYKLFDENWISGAAVMYISRVDAFSSAPFRFLFAENYGLSALATYLILAYQGLFGVLVWIRRVKIPFLWFGVFFHLGIAFGMGIFTFGILMCLVYVLFLTDEQVEKIWQKFQFRKTA